MQPHIVLDKNSNLELSRQIYEQIKNAVLDGRLKPGERIFSSRELCQELAVSRPTVATSYDQLALEGYIEMRHGSGTFVCQSLKAPLSARKRLVSPRALRGRSLSDFRRTAEVNTLEGAEEARKTTKAEKAEIIFQYGRPSLEHFPHAQWARIVGRIARDAHADDLANVCDKTGHIRLRQAIAEAVQKFRGLAVSAEQVIVVNGVNQGLDLVARLQLTPASLVVMEDPGYPFAAQIFKANSARLLPLSLDGEGIVLEREKNSIKNKSEAILEKTRLLYVTPSHQFPHGVTMSLTRRLELLAFAKRNSAMILEDDFDSEYQTSGKPIPALMSLDRADCVVYSGSFNQLIFPSLNIGYLLVPKSLVSVYGQGRRLLGEQANLQTQLALAEFIESGELERHWRRMKTIYSEKRDALIAALDKHMTGAYRLDGDQCGVFVRLILRTKHSVAELSKRALAKGVQIFSTAEFYAQESGAEVPTNEYIFGFGNLTAEEIERGIKLLAQVL